MAKCQQCGTEAASKFCPSCGAQILQAPPVAAAAQAPQYPPQQPLPPQYPPPGYQQPGHQGYPMPPQKQSSPWKWIGIIGAIVGGLLVILIALVLVLGDDATNTQGQPATVAGGPVTTSAIKKAPVITDKVNEKSQAPIGELKTVPAATDWIYAAVDLEVKKGDVLLAKWYYGGKPQSHLDTELPADEDFRGWASFNIDNGGAPWPAGQYKFEIYLNGKKAQEKSFDVK